MRWFNPDKSPEDPLKPAILVSFIANPDLFLHSILIGLKRAYDLKLALQRKFPVRQHVVPFVVYNHAASERSSVFSQPIFIRGDENLDNLMHHFFTLYSYPIPPPSNFEFEKKVIILQQGLCQILNRQTPQDPNFDSALKTEPKTSSCYPFYMETLKSLILMTNEGVINSYRPFYQHILKYFRSDSIEQNEKNWFLYSVSNDFSLLNNTNIIQKFNQRTVPTPYIEYCSANMRLFDILNNRIQAYLNSIHNQNSGYIPDISVLNDLLQQAIQRYCQLGDTKGIMILLNSKLPFNINQINSSGLLYTACIKNDTECVRILCSIPGIDINQVTEYPQSALSFSCYQGYTEIVRILCAVPGIDVNNSRDKIPPLFQACDRGHTEIVHILCARPDLNINQINKFETTALNVARTRNHTDIVDIIMRAR